jgi:hypothetical protein
MKRKTLLLTIGIMTALLLAAFQAGKALATASCFTDTGGHWAETFICWLKENGLTTGYGDGTYRPENNITRAEMAVLLKRQAEIPPTTGLVLVTPGNSEWVKFSSTDDLSFINYSDYTQVTKATAGEAYLTLQPAIPTVLYGRSMKVTGVEFCYTGEANTYLSYVEINTHTAAAGAGNRTLQFADPTDRSDSVCLYYALPANFTLTPDDGLSFYILIHWNAGGTNFYLGRTTFVLQPSGSQVVFPKALTETVVNLSQSLTAGDVPSTSAP